MQAVETSLTSAAADLEKGWAMGSKWHAASQHPGVTLSENMTGVQSKLENVLQDRRQQALSFHFALKGNGDAVLVLVPSTCLRTCFSHKLHSRTVYLQRQQFRLISRTPGEQRARAGDAIRYSLEEDEGQFVCFRSKW